MACIYIHRIRVVAGVESTGQDVQDCALLLTSVFLMLTLFYPFTLQGEERRRRHDVIFPDGLPPIPQEPMVLLCVSLLLLVIGRIIYLQVSADSEPHSQV